MRVRALITAGITVLGSATALASPVPAAGQAPVERGHVVSTPAVHYDHSAPLRSMKPAKPLPGNHAHPALPLPRQAGTGRATPSASSTGTATPTTLLNFAGVGNGFSGPSGAFAVTSAPPDTTGAVGPNHYVQMVNTDFAVFNKSGTAVYGPVPTNTLWSGFGGGCETNNDGDGQVRYDPMADRWVLSQFSVSTTPYLECVAVSQTGDPTGAYNRYSFSYGTTDFPDYPKMGVWPDGYYFSYNMFAGSTTFSGAEVCALDRSAMLTGASATQQCAATSSTYGGVLAASMDGSRQPPAGSPEYIVGLGASAGQLAYWRYHVDWTTPANSTFTGPVTLTVASYALACGGGTCIPQSGTTQQLDSLADRMMDRLAYRNFGDHEALVVNHTVTAGSSAGVRWYELRPDASHNLSVFQQGTYAPDASYRWMGSVAQDQAGDIALGFSVSSTSLHPEIHYTGRLAGDAPGTMTQGEGTIIDGAGSQSGQNLSRWGDYSNLSVDPSDDCTFWYTNEYIPATGAFNWATRIGSFKFPGCGTTVTNDFSMSASPSSLTVNQGDSATSTISTTTTSGAAQTVSLSVSGVPAGATASLSPTSVTSGSGSTLTLSAGTATSGTYTITVTGTGASATHSTTVTLVVPANDFSMSASPSAVSTNQGDSAMSTISTATTSGAAQTVSFSVSGLPSGASASFSPTSVSSGGASTLTLASGSAPAGTYTVTVTGTGTSATHAVSLTWTVVANDFSMSASPSTVTVQLGGSATTSVSTAVTSGNAQNVVLSVSGLPSGTTASFSPSSVSSGGGSTLTVSSDLTPATGSYSVVLTGTGTWAAHSVTITLVVAKAATTLRATPLSVGMSATLTRSDSGAAIGGQVITFQAGGATCTGMTNAVGTATCTDKRTLKAAKKAGGYQAVFAGTAVYVGSSATAGPTAPATALRFTV